MKILDRLKTELNNQNYFPDDKYTMFLQENNLAADSEYNKTENQRDLLLCVVDILEAVSNDIDIMRKVSDGTTDFTTDQAYKFLRMRIQDVKQRISSLPISEENYSNVSLLFTRGRR